MSSCTINLVSFYSRAINIMQERGKTGKIVHRLKKAFELHKTIRNIKNNWKVEGMTVKMDGGLLKTQSRR